jgi:predicted hotdog family 3-hydroxylacyl-ACP dehydratase
MLLKEENIHSIIPQRPPIVMVDELVYNDGESTRCGFKVKSDNIFVEDGILQEAGLIENMAQTAAAGTGYQAQQQGLPAPVGFIGAVQNLEIISLPKTGDYLLTEVKITNQVFDVTFIDSEISSNNQLVARCNMKIFVPKTTQNTAN